MEAYDGSVVRARLDTMGIPPGRFPRRQDPRKLLMSDWRIDVTFVKGTPPRSLSPILNIYDEKHREVDLLGAEGQDFVFREGSRARAFRLDQPDLRLPGAIAATAEGDTAQAAVVRSGPDRCLTFETTSACPGFTPGRAWSLLLYPELGPVERRSLDALWMFLLLLPVGFWSRNLRRLAAAGVATGLTVGLAVALTRSGDADLGGGRGCRSRARGGSRAAAPGGRTPRTFPLAGLPGPVYLGIRSTGLRTAFARRYLPAQIP